MTLTSIVDEIELKAKGREIGRLQEIRKELHGFQRLPARSIFHPDTIKEKAGYAFHFGGRKELQFNVGFEDGKFRHGVAFSFEPSQTLPNFELLIPNVKRFNEFLALYPQQYSDLLMWHWHKGVRSSEHPPTPITDNLVRQDVFVFLGRLQPSHSIDFEMIVSDFDRLLPLYRFVEGKNPFPELTTPLDSSLSFEAGCTPKPSSTTATIVKRALDVRLVHNDIEFALYRHLCTIHGKQNVRAELPNAGGLVDVAVRLGDKFWFYEIKTALSARGCIREGLAQLLEYSFWPGAQIAEKLVIVGEPEVDEDSENYLARLRDSFGLPIEYRQFDLSSGVLL